MLNNTYIYIIKSPYDTMWTSRVNHLFWGDELKPMQLPLRGPGILPLGQNHSQGYRIKFIGPFMNLTMPWILFMSQTIAFGEFSTPAQRRQAVWVISFLRTTHFFLLSWVIFCKPIISIRSSCRSELSENRVLQHFMALKWPIKHIFPPHPPNL